MPGFPRWQDIFRGGGYSAPCHAATTKSQKIFLQDKVFQNPGGPELGQTAFA